MLIVSAAVGVQRMTREHFALAVALKLPTFIVVTKADMCSPRVVQQVVGTLKSIIKVRGLLLAALCCLSVPWGVA